MIAPEAVNDDALVTKTNTAVAARDQGQIAFLAP
jgi:hypothetical protein